MTTKKTKLRGRTSTVAKGESLGGMLTVRLKYPLHKRFANLCIQDGVSMNATLIMLIEKHIQERLPSESRNTLSSDAAECES